jgi:hypothetical protein
MQQSQPNQLQLWIRMFGPKQLSNGQLVTQLARKMVGAMRKPQFLHQLEQLV